MLRDVSAGHALLAQGIEGNPRFIADLKVLHAPGLLRTVLGAHRGPIDHAIREPGPPRRVGVGHQRGCVERGFLRGLTPQERILEVDDQDRFRLQVPAKAEELVVAESVRHGFARVARARRSFRSAAGDVVDHVAPVQEVDVRAAGEPHDRHVEFRQQPQRLGLKAVRTGHHGPFNARFAPTRLLHELAEQPVVDGAHGLVSDVVDGTARRDDTMLIPCVDCRSPGVRSRRQYHKSDSFLSSTKAQDSVPTTAPVTQFTSEISVSRSGACQVRPPSADAINRQLAAASRPSGASCQVRCTREPKA